MHGRRLSIASSLVCVLTVGCGGVDQQKFDGIYKAGKALQTEVDSTHGAPASPARDRLKEFDAAIDALRDHTVGRQESDALGAYAEAADAYRYFLRFRNIETEGGGSEIPLKGPNLEVATRYKLPVDTRGGVKSVNRAQAITILLQAAEQHLNDGNRIIGHP